MYSINPRMRMAVSVANLTKMMHTTSSADYAYTRNVLMYDTMHIMQGSLSLGTNQLTLFCKIRLILQQCHLP